MMTAMRDAQPTEAGRGIMEELRMENVFQHGPEEKTARGQSDQDPARARCAPQVPEGDPQSHQTVNDDGPPRCGRRTSVEFQCRGRAVARKCHETLPEIHGLDSPRQ